MQSIMRKIMQNRTLCNAVQFWNLQVLLFQVMLAVVVLPHLVLSSQAFLQVQQVILIPGWSLELK